MLGNSFDRFADVLNLRPRKDAFLQQGGHCCKLALMLSPQPLLRVPFGHIRAEFSRDRSALTAARCAATSRWFVVFGSVKFPLSRVDESEYGGRVRQPRTTVGKLRMRMDGPVLAASVMCRMLRASLLICRVP